MKYLTAHKLSILLTSIVMAFLASACATTNANSPETVPAQCNAESVQNLVGQKLSSSITENIRAKSKASSVRVINDKQAVTMEFNPARVNIHLDKDEKITMITCG